MSETCKGAIHETTNTMFLTFIGQSALHERGVAREGSCENGELIEGGVVREGGRVEGEFLHRGAFF